MQQQAPANVANLLPVTVWSRKNDKDEWEHNHLESGHVPDGTTHPTPKHESHKSAWRRGKWKAEFAYLTHDKPARVVRR